MKTEKLILLIAGLVLFGIMTAVGQNTGIKNSQTGIVWYELDDAQKLARENDKKVLIFAEASWCSFCKKMKRDVFPEPDIQKATSTYFYPVKIDIESDKLLKYNGQEMTQMQFSRQMQVTATPTFFFINAEGSIIGTQPGFIPRDVYKLLLTYVGTDAYNEVGFKEYLENR